MAQGEGRLRQRLDRQTHEQRGIVVRRYPVGMEDAAGFTAVDDGPLTAFPHPYRHRLHGAAALGGPVTGLIVQMDAGQAVGAVVAVVAPGPLGTHGPAADTAGEYVAARLCTVVGFSAGLISGMHGVCLLESDVFSASGRSC